MKKTWMILIGVVIAAIVVSAVTAALLLSPSPGSAQVRVLHASPDAPAVDVWVNDALAFENIASEEITAYAALAAGSYNVKVVPTGATSPVVIEADLDLEADTWYTVAAIDQLADIRPLVLTDNSGTVAADKSWVRFVHTSPDAPAVDIAVKGGPVIFENVGFPQIASYLEVASGMYDLEVRLAGTTTAVLDLSSIPFDGSTTYTVYAVGLVGEGSLNAILATDS